MSIVAAILFFLINLASMTGNQDAVLPPCPSDDGGINCYWDAETMGNGEGKSFVVINGTYYYMGE